MKTPQDLERDHADALIAHVRHLGPLADIQRLRYWWLYTHGQPSARHLDALLGYLCRWGRLVPLSPILYALPAERAAESDPPPPTRARAIPAPPAREVRVGQAGWRNAPVPRVKPALPLAPMAARVLAAVRERPGTLSELQARLPDMVGNTLRGRLSDLGRRGYLRQHEGRWEVAS